MNTRKRFILGLLASFVVAPACWAQPAVPIAAPAAPNNLWTFLLPNAQQKAACKDCFCNSPLGKLTSGAAGPMAMMSGGLIANRCAQNAIDKDIAKKPPTSSEGAAARIKKDEAEAKARRDAVRFLGTVDCNYWPEATDALVNSLRKDRNECVRFEAALALRNGCCCNEKTVKALEISVSGSDKDGNPPERSDRVRAVAAEALAICPLLQKETEGKEGEIKKTEATTPGEYYGRLTPAQREQVVSSARGVLVSLQQANQGSSSGTANTVAAMQQRSGSLSGIFANAFATNSAVAAPVMAKAHTKPLSLYELVTARSTKQEYIVPAMAEHVVPVSVPAKMPRDAGPIIVQGGLTAPQATGLPSANREAIGYITVDPAPLPPIEFRPSRP